MPTALVSRDDLWALQIAQPEDPAMARADLAVAEKVLGQQATAVG
jgi:hypothetical protein